MTTDAARDRDELTVLPDPRLVCEPMAAPRIGLVIVGDEILSGKREDKHLRHCIGLLGERGMALSWARYVGDEREALVEVLKQGFAASDLLLCCGGIGATPDDQTRQSAAEALGVPLALHPQARLLIEARMQQTAVEQGVPYEPQQPDNVHRLNMGMFPQGASLLPNAYNLIPGFSCLTPQGHGAHFMPGFPVMAWPMVVWVLDQYASAWHHRSPQAVCSVRVFGVWEGTLAPELEALLMRHEGVKVFSLPTVSHPELGPHIEVGVKGQPDVVAAAFADLRQALLRLGARLSDAIH